MDAATKRGPVVATAAGAGVGTLGGLLGLGGAEFRLPLLVAVFNYPLRRAVPINLAVSFVAVVVAAVVRWRFAKEAPSPGTALLTVCMMAGGMLGAALGARWLASVSDERLYAAVRFLLVVIGVLLIIEAATPWTSSGLPLGSVGRGAIAFTAGLLIGAVSTLLGAAGGEMIIPTLVLVFGVPIKAAGTTSLLISIPTMLVGLTRHHAGRLPGCRRGAARGRADGVGDGSRKRARRLSDRLCAGNSRQGVTGNRAHYLGAARVQGAGVNISPVPDRQALVRGLGDIGSAVAHRLFTEGYNVVIHDDVQPATTRRTMAFTDAAFEGAAALEGVEARRASDVASIPSVLALGFVTVYLGPIEPLTAALRFAVLVDARMRKRDVPEDQRGLAAITVGLGPNFEVGVSCDVAVETSWDALGAVIRSGATLPLAGEPRAIGGYARERYVYAPAAGIFQTTMQIGDEVRAGQPVATIGETILAAPLSGVLRGLTRHGVSVAARTKVIEVDPRGRAAPQAAGIAERPRRIAEGVIAAIGEPRW